MPWRLNRKLSRTAMLVVVVLGACQPRPAGTPLNQIFGLSPGQSTRIADEKLEIGFARVVSDSRCPQGASCVQAGEAIASLWAQEPGTMEKNAFEARVRGGVPGLDSTTAQAEVGNYRVQLLALEPYPKPAVAIDSTRFIARLRVTRR